MMRRLAEVGLVVSVLVVVAAIFGGIGWAEKSHTVLGRPIETIQEQRHSVEIVVDFPILSLEDSIEQVINSVVHIRNITQGWQGSGVLVAPDIILTARHVAEGGDDFDVTLNGGTVVKSYRALTSKKYDIGFLQLEKPIYGFMNIDGERFEAIAKLGSISDCRLGQSIFAIGSPFGEVNRNSVTLGIISRLECDLEKFDCPLEMGWSAMFQTDANGEPGNSGCPVFSLDGVVRGVLVGGFSNGIVYCIPSDVFMNDLDTIRQLFAQDKYEFEEGFVPVVEVY